MTMPEVVYWVSLALAVIAGIGLGWILHNWKY